MEYEEKSADSNTADEAARWLDEIAKAKNRSQKYFEMCKKISKRYRDDRGVDWDTNNKTGNYRYNVLWSNKQTELPMLYSRMPRPVIERRFKDDDPVGRVASEMWEKATTTAIDLNGFDRMMKNSTFEYALYSQGTSWALYKPTIQDIEIDEQTGQPKQSVLKYEESVADFVSYRNFYYSDSRTWPEVNWVAREVYMNKPDGLARFGEIFNKVPLDHKQETGDKELSASSKYNKATIYEIWCKPDNMVYWVAKEYKEAVLDMSEPHLKFDGFFPCPMPAFGTNTTDVIEPVPDYKQYQDQAIELDEVSCRISYLLKSIKITGVYDASVDPIKNLLKEGVDNQLFPFDSKWSEFVTKGGMRGTLELLPIDQAVSALGTLYQSREAILQTIYQITGMSDIIRGASNPNETATAQQIKGKFGTMRLQDKQGEIQRFARDNIRLIAEIIAENFQPETLMKMSGMKLPTRQDVQAKFQLEMQQFQAKMQQYQQVAMQAQQSGQQPPPPPQQPQQPEVVTIDDVMELLRDDPMRNFRIDIETDSTIATDYEEEKNSRMELISSIGPFMQQMVPLVQQSPELSDLMGQILLFGVRGFKAGRSLEASFEDVFKQIKEQQAQPPSPPPPDPEIELKKEQSKAELQLQKEKQDGELSLKKQEIDGNLALKQEEIKGNMMLDRRNIIGDALGGQV